MYVRTDATIRKLDKDTVMDMRSKTTLITAPPQYGHEHSKCFLNS